MGTCVHFFLIFFLEKGQYLAMDPNGRAVMIGAIEKQKFVYILTRNAQAKLVQYHFGVALPS